MARGEAREPDAVDAALSASRALLAVVARSLVDVLDQVTLPQYRILVVLCEWGPMRSGALAERVGVHQSTFTRTADRLVAGGWVRRETSPESRREVVVHLTPAGRDLVVGVMDRRRAELGAVLAALSEQERQAVGEALATFARAAGEPAPDELVTLGL